MFKQSREAGTRDQFFSITTQDDESDGSGGSSDISDSLCVGCGTRHFHY